MRSEGMRFLVVYCHPVPESFCAAIRDVAVEALRGKGHEVRLLDLHAEGFDPVMYAEERRTYNELAPQDPKLQPHVDNLRWAEGILLVYPTWWYGPPAMLKGWFDRVWAKDVTFTFDKTGRIKPIMEHITKLGIVTTCGAPHWWSFLIGQPGKKTILRGIRANCAWLCKTMFLAHYVMDNSTPETRAAFLEKVRKRVAAF
jgi:NAD(P)H dehydrogenase (quinone)